ncbi:MAG: hypothetical protein WC683_05795 [bacterium]
MDTGLWIPAPTIAPTAFIRWVKERYPGLSIGWNTVKCCYALMRQNVKTKQWEPFKLLKRPDGTNVPLNDEGRKFIIDSVCHSSERNRDDMAANVLVNEHNRRQQRAQDDLIRYAILSNTHYIGRGSRTFMGN